MRKLSVNTGGVQRVPKAPLAKRVAPPAVPDVYRHSGSSFGSVSFASCDELDDRALPVPPPQLTHKAAVLFHQQMALQEDQGIDLTQSPGRDSPGSSSGSAGSGSRHSTVSLDSGRASSYLTTSTRGALSSPRCSMSSCSITSVDRMARNDYDIIQEWLAEIQSEEYAQCFAAAGYDLPTVARMTPEDLTAIGIKNPHHRERIKAHIDALHLADELPNYVPGSIDEWLHLLRLEEYAGPLLAQGYQTVRDVTQLTWEDLEDIGIVRLGHQKKILLAIKRVQDIISGKWVASPGQCIAKIHQECARNIYPRHCESTKLTDDIVVIQVRQTRRKSLESLEDPDERMMSSHLTFNNVPDTLYCHQNSPIYQIHPYSSKIGTPFTNMPWRRSYDDGDITPTNETTTCEETSQGGGTLPRHVRGGARARPVAKVVALSGPPRQIASPEKGGKFWKKEPPSPPRRQVPQIAADMYIPPHYQNHLHCTTVEVHNVRNQEARSTSSIDSIDAMPFANDNAGTIKQRLSREGHHVSLSSSSSSTSSTSSAKTVAHAFDGPSPEGPPLDSNVLNDIGNMLANLTDELDAMLEEEKRQGLNDNE
ncbi:caskin-1 isoform X2 [Lutzomyia longipalpis]|uniref:caskin-1 isoform X2 n=1 Tax=Lutzomyia longipalpis TaxID=7200 RepID=UPI0024838F2A|nr:caskin-1 isoform X2 [Lutzomyia longipalpis]